ncbi:XRI1 protein [Spatholobus suberectus]|nr:XRI1 protein [Spatholobus suberectus]
MDYKNNDDGAREPWDWQGENYCLKKTSDFEISEELWNDVPQNEEDLSYMFDDETTPVKACGDLAYNVTNGDSNNIQKELEECRETSSQVKRRRMLQFNSQDRDQSLSNEDMSLPYLKNGKEDPTKDIFPEVSQWVSGASGNASASGYVDLESSETWLAEYFNDAEMDISPDELNFSGADDVQIDVAELNAITPSHEQNAVQKHVPRTSRNIIFKGRKSFIHTPTKLPSSVAYPFAFIKPSGAHGDVTLKEINQRIRTPPPSKSKQSIDDPAAYPKSAFSGKPVVGKTKIRTEGGKGSIDSDLSVKGLGEVKDEVCGRSGKFLPLQTNNGILKMVVKNKNCMYIHIHVTRIRSSFWLQPVNVNEITNEPVNELANELVNDHVTESVHRCVDVPVTEHVNDSINDCVNEHVTKVVGAVDGNGEVPINEEFP